MKIPWKKLAKDPILVTINEVYIIVSPNIGKYDIIIYNYIMLYIRS